MRQDIFGNKKPVAIEMQEWWFNGNIIQQQNHPKLNKYFVWKDLDGESYIVYPFTKKEDAVKHCLDNPCKQPNRFPKDYLG